jgi:hypothetical protein
VFVYSYVIYSLFNDDVNNADYIVSISMTANNKFEKMCKKAIEDYFKALSGQLPGRAEGKFENLSRNSRCPCRDSERLLTDTNENYYRSSQPTWFKCSSYLN